MPRADLPAETAQLGNYRLELLPPKSNAATIVIFALIPMAIGIAMFFVPEFVTPKTPEDKAGATIMFYCFGVFLLLCGGVVLFVPFLFKPPQAHVFDGGLFIREGKTDSLIPWSEIQLLKIHEWYDNRFSPCTFNVAIHRTGGKPKVGFSTTQTKDVESIATQVKNVEFVPFSA